MSSTTPHAAARSPFPCQTGLSGHWDFFAMNTRVQLFTRDWCGSDLLRQAEVAFHVAEARFSRFLPSSELAMLNACAGTEVAVSPDMYDLLARSVRYYRLSDGLFDPGVLPLLESAGYDRSFEFLIQQDGHVTQRRPGPKGGSIAALALDGSRLAIRAPKGLRLDLGGIAKGATVDRAREVLAPAEDYLIDAGGDIYAAGDGPDGNGWLVGVADPLREDEDLTLVRLHNQALATSSISRRRWRQAGRWMHHLVDPITEKPAINGVASVSTIAPTAIEADVFAKVALLLGVGAGTRFLRARRAHGLFALSDGSWQTTKHWPGGYE